MRRMVDKKVDLEPVVKRVSSRKFNCWNDDKLRSPDEEGKSLEIQLLK